MIYCSLNHVFILISQITSSCHHADVSRHFDSSSLQTHPCASPLSSSIDTRAESKEDSEGDSSELSEVLAYLDKSAAEKRDVVSVLPTSSIMPTIESACKIGVMLVTEKDKIIQQGQGGRAGPFSAKEPAAIRKINPAELEPEKQSVLLREILSFSPTAIRDSKETNAVPSTILPIRPSVTARTVMADASRDGVALIGPRGGGRGGYNRQSRAAALSSQVLNGDEDEDEDNSDDDDDDDEGWKSARNNMKSKASRYISLPCPIVTKPMTSLSSSSSNTDSGVDAIRNSLQSDVTPTANSSASTIFIAGREEDYSNEHSTPAAEAIVKDIIASNADTAAADRRPVLASTASSSAVGTNSEPDAQSDSHAAEPQQHVSGSGSLLIRRSATNGRKRIVPRMLQPVQI